MLEQLHISMYGNLIGEMDENQTFSHILIQGYGDKIENWTKKPNMRDTFSEFSNEEYSNLQKKSENQERLLGG